MRALLRLLGLILLAGAFAAAIVDGTRSAAAGHAVLLPLSAAITKLSPDGLTRLRALVQGKLPVLWDPVLVTVLLLPTFAMLGVFGLLLVVAGRPRRPRIGYGRR